MRTDIRRGLAVMVRRQLRVNRTALLVLTAIITLNDIVQVTAYESVFPNPATRAATLASFTSNGALRALYGYPFDITSPTGWLVWRSLGFMVMVTAVWGAFITAGALRGEEEAGRAELVLSRPQSRRLWFAAALAAVAIEACVLGAVNALGLALVCVPRHLMTLPDCLEVSLLLILPALLFAAVGAVTSQLFGTTRSARLAAVAVVVLAFFVRTVADAGSGIGWLRWTTPLGWFEELHPPSVPSPAALAAIVLTSAVLLAGAWWMLEVRDIGRALLPQYDSRRPRRYLLGTPWQAALRDELPQLTLWLAGSLFYTLLLGGLSKTLLDLVKSNSAFGKLFTTRFNLDAFVAASFSVVQVIVTLLVVTMLVGARGEEASGRLELVLAEPRSRPGWLLSRTALAAGVSFALTLVSAVALWTGAALAGESVAFGSVIAAAGNCLPLIVLTAGVAVAVLAVAPRATAFVYAPVAVAYLWEAIGTSLQAPTWSLDLSPFHVLAAVPAQPFAPLPAALLTVLGLILVAGGVSVFRRRDLAAG